MAEEVIELTYDRFGLPTTQHRAGLAGFLVLLESLRRRKVRILPEVSWTSESKVMVRLTIKTLGLVFDDLYDATWEERKSESKPQGKTIRNLKSVEAEVVDKRTGQSRKKKSYTFEAIGPKAKFLDVLGMPASWVKLWREALFSCVRGRDRQRGAYKDRVAGKSVRETQVVWGDLLRFKEAKSKNELLAVNLSGSLFLGAQDTTAERVPFCGSPDENLLLHFWPVVMGAYVPEVIDSDGKRNFAGYVLAVPDVSELDDFVQEFPDTAARLGSDVVGFRPKEAIISVPQEGGLEYLHNVMRLAKGKAAISDLAYSVAGIEIYHLEKRGNNIRVLTADRVAARREILEKYEAIRGRYQDPLFRRQIMLNLLREEPWYRGFEHVFARNNQEQFIGRQAWDFPADVRKMFK